MESFSMHHHFHSSLPCMLLLGQRDSFALFRFTRVLVVPYSCSFEVVGFRLHAIITFFVCIYILTGKYFIDPFSIFRQYLIHCADFCFLYLVWMLELLLQLLIDVQGSQRPMLSLLGVVLVDFAVQDF